MTSHRINVWRDAMVREPLVWLGMAALSLRNPAGHMHRSRWCLSCFT